MKLYKALVHLHLEVGMSLASPYFKNDKEILERVQQKATKMVEGLKQMPYKEFMSLETSYSYTGGNVVK